MLLNAINHLFILHNLLFTFFGELYNKIFFNSPIIFLQYYIVKYRTGLHTYSIVITYNNV